MKKTIGICLFMGMILAGGLLLFSGSLEGSGEKKSAETPDRMETGTTTQNIAATETEQMKAQESMAVQESYQYMIREVNGLLVVYKNDNTTIFLETNISVSTLEQSTLQKLEQGIYFSNEEELFTFLESCSS